MKKAESRNRIMSKFKEKITKLVEIKNMDASSTSTKFLRKII